MNKTVEVEPVAVPDEVLEHYAEEYLKGQTILTFEQYIKIKYPSTLVKQRTWQPLLKSL